MTATTDAPADRRQGFGSNRLLLVIGAGVAALVFVAMALVLLLPHPEPVYPAGSPEAAFQSYLRAWDAGDDKAAYAALSPRVRASWTYDGYLLEQDQYRQYDNERRVFIDRVETAEDEATLHLTIEWSGGGALTSSRWYERDVRIRMTKVEGTWYVDQALLGTQSTYR